MTRRRPKRLYAVLIAPNGAFLDQRDALAELGFTVALTRSLLTGYAQVCRLLAPDQAANRTLILLDTQGTAPGFPEFPGAALAAVLARQMRLGELQPAWLAGVTSGHAPEDDAEALVAGCQRVVHLPLTSDTLLSLRSLMKQPAPLPHRDLPPEQARASSAYQMLAQRVFQAVRSAQVRTWTPEDVALLLRWLTPYPALASTVQQAVVGADEAPRIEVLLRALGGVRAARQRLESIATQWQTRYPLHSDILQKFLDGWERREIVRYFVAQRLYEDSRIYHCIKELPRRICEQLRREQVARQEDWSID